MLGIQIMKIPRDLWQELCSYENLELAFKKARKHKTIKDYVHVFEKNLQNNLLFLRSELLLHSYRPRPLVNFVIRDPKTRKISKSDFRDRIIHHAICNIIEPIFEKTFIYDSYANRKGKGALNALLRFDYFKRKMSRNNTRKCFILKADIKKYFENVNHKILIKIIREKIKDRRIIRLIQIIFANGANGASDFGMPLGNLTSQFFANVFLNKLDYYVKNTLRIKQYIRYVDDFVILSNDEKKLKKYLLLINEFLRTHLMLVLHPDKSKIIELKQGIGFLGFRIFYHHKLLRKANIRKMQKKIQSFCSSPDLFTYDSVYDSFQGWCAYAMHANSYQLRQNFGSRIQQGYSGAISSAELDKFIRLARVC